nr:MAG TPA: hypothetical protein [Microviridae sp.]
MFIMSDKNIISGLSSAIAVVVQPIESLRFYTDEDGCIHMNSDVNLLMNAERIRNQIGEENYLNIIRSIQPSRSPYKQKLDDDALIETLKSRYLQSPAEVDAWMASLEQEYQDMVAEVREAATASQPRVEEAATASQSNVDPKPAQSTE